MDNYEVSWQSDIDETCPDIDIRNTIVSTSPNSYSITGLEEDSSYAITVTAINAAGRVHSIAKSGTTNEAGKGLVNAIIINMSKYYFFYSSICCSN